MRFIRKLLQPVLKLLFNPNALNHVLHTQVGINDFLMARAARDVLVYEVMHNLVVEVTRASIEVKNMKMRVESIASRLEFNERRARALEAVVQYRPDAERGRDHDRDRDTHRGRRVAPTDAAPCTSRAQVPWIPSRAATACGRAASAAAAAGGADRGSGTRLAGLWSFAPASEASQPASELRSRPRAAAPESWRPGRPEARGPRLSPGVRRPEA